MPNLFETKSTILRPRAVKVQSPPYPVTGAEEAFIGEWSGVTLDSIQIRVSIDEVENVDIGFNSNITEISLDSLIIEYIGNDDVNIRFDNNITEINLDTVIVEYQISGTDDQVDMFFDNNIFIDFQQDIVITNNSIESTDIHFNNSITVELT